MEKKLALEMYEYITEQLKVDFTEFAYKYGEELFKNGSVAAPAELVEMYLNMMANELMLSKADLFKISMQEASNSITQSMEKSRKIIEGVVVDSKSTASPTTSGDKNMN